MNKKVGGKGKNTIETTQQFRQLINVSMGKMKDTHTTQTALEELKDIMQVHVTSTDRMNMLISIFAEQNEHMGIAQRKEGLKLFGIMGEVFGESLLQFIPKLLSICSKKFEDCQVHISISDSIGVMVHHVFKHLNSLEEKETTLTNIVNQLFSFLRSSNKNIQIGTAMTLTRILQNSPIEALNATLSQLTDLLLELIQASWIKCSTQLLEALISLVLAVEYEFEPYGKKFIPALVECINSKNEWNTRKMGIDVIYTFAAFLPDCIADDIEIIIKALKERKADKIKHVREAAQEALTKIKEAKNKTGRPLHESPSKVVIVDIPQEDKKEANIHNPMMQGKSIFRKPINPNFIKAAPKSNSTYLKNL